MKNQIKISIMTLILIMPCINQAAQSADKALIDATVTSVVSGIQREEGLNPINPNKANDDLLGAVCRNDSSLVQTLLNAGAQTNFAGNCMPLHIASEIGLPEIVKILLQEGANPNIKNNWNLTALGAAIIGQQPEIVKILLAAGVNPNETDSGGRTALEQVGERDKSIEIAGILLKADARRSTNSWTNKQLTDAIRIGDQNRVQKILDLGADPNTKDSNFGYPGLNYAVIYNGDINILKKLLTANADPNLSDNFGDTALISVIKNPEKSKSRKEHIEKIQLLLDAGADPDIKNNEGKTALMEAARFNAAEIAQELLKKNADPNIRDKQGNTALMVATQHYHYETQKLLQK
ncbi:hypothetical protein A3J41_01985 [candidate division TM6 bacterium RIFCSPHIGHO2_12_FULL_38_8]|nr:MAG: hypothetical protein A3J41_01985 [candidate division TM6 bacterium RIFCSPHIGHO2_12_FULL_38_8]